MRNIISIMRDIGTFMTEYSFSEMGLVEKTGDDCGSVLFFSKRFLKEHNFVLAPIWEGSLKGLILDADNRANMINPIQNIQSHLIQQGYNEVNYVCCGLI